MKRTRIARVHVAPKGIFLNARVARSPDKSLGFVCIVVLHRQMQMRTGAEAEHAIQILVGRFLDVVVATEIDEYRQHGRAIRLGPVRGGGRGRG